MYAQQNIKTHKMSLPFMFSEFILFCSMLATCLPIVLSLVSSSSSSSARRPLVDPGLVKKLCQFVSVEGDLLPILDL